MKSLFILLFFVSANFYAAAQTTAVDSTKNRISIMTWNVKLLPRIATFLKHSPVVRAKIIPNKLIQENPDVIVFQEAYDRTSIRIIRKKMEHVYPFIAGLKNRSGITYKRAGGVLIFSKYPIREIESIRYTNSIGIDKSAGKGAILAEVNHPIQKFQVLGTHMQAGGTSEIKQGQFVQAAALMKRHEQDSIPQFACGDFNVRKSDTTLYPKLLQILNVEDGEISTELKATSDHLLNDMDSYDPNRRHIIDYVFINPKGIKPKAVIRSVKQIKERWSKKNQDLSDHFPVILDCYF